MSPLFFFIASMSFLYLYAKYLISPLNLKTLELANSPQDNSWRAQLGFLLAPLVPLLFITNVVYVVVTVTRFIGLSESTGVLVACFVLVALGAVGVWYILSRSKSGTRG